LKSCYVLHCCVYVEQPSSDIITSRLSCDVELQDPESPAAVLVLRLFGVIFDVMAKYNVKTDDILLPVFPRLISRTQELAAAAKNPSGACLLWSPWGGAAADPISGVS
jgi:hypothetical protein